MDKTKPKNHLYELVNDFDVAMLVTQGNRSIHARPMAIARLDEEMCAFLVTDINSVKVDEIYANPCALLTFQGSRKYASVRGELAVVLDRTMIELMWKEVWKVWFPKGKSDPNIALLKFTAQEGEFWDNAGMLALKYVYSAAKAYVVGETPKSDEELHAKVSL